MFPIPAQSLPRRSRSALGEGLLLPFQHSRRWITLPQIIRLEGVGNYTTCFFADGSTLLIALSLKRLANRLPAGAFLRPHRKHLINRQYIEAVYASKHTVALTNGDVLAVARRRLGAFVVEYRRCV